MRVGGLDWGDKRLDWSDKRLGGRERAALDLWANHVAVIVAQANGANITKLRR